MTATPMQPPFVADKPITAYALNWAAERHRGQLRDVDSAPFILHPLEVAALLSGGGYEDAVVAAGLLHDVVEDTATSADEVRERFGAQVGDLVAAVTEDPSIADYHERKSALRAAVEAAGRNAAAVFAADKVVKARELRAQASQSPASLEEPGLRDRLEHYEQSLDMLQRLVPDLPLAHQLEFELWALRRLPPPGRRDAT